MTPEEAAAEKAAEEAAQKVDAKYDGLRDAIVTSLVDTAGSKGHGRVKVDAECAPFQAIDFAPRWNRDLDNPASSSTLKNDLGKRLWEKHIFLDSIAAGANNTMIITAHRATFINAAIQWAFPIY